MLGDSRERDSTNPLYLLTHLLVGVTRGTALDDGGADPVGGDEAAAASSANASSATGAQWIAVDEDAGRGVGLGLAVGNLGYASVRESQLGVRVGCTACAPNQEGGATSTSTAASSVCVQLQLRGAVIVLGVLLTLTVWCKPWMYRADAIADYACQLGLLTLALTALALSTGLLHAWQPDDETDVAVAAIGQNASAPAASAGDTHLVDGLPDVPVSIPMDFSAVPYPAGVGAAEALLALSALLCAYSPLTLLLRLVRGFFRRKYR